VLQDRGVVEKVFDGEDGALAYGERELGGHAATWKIRTRLDGVKRSRQ
jgi:hypothetical protein